MSDAILEILLLEAYLAIGLLAVAFAIFTLSITYLKKEKAEIEKEKNNKLREINHKIATLAEKKEKSTGSNLREIEDQLKKAKDELKKAHKSYIPLTVNGAVLSPVLYLSAALLASIGSIYMYEFGNTIDYLIFSLGSAVLISIAMYQFYETLKILERAALRTEFDAGFSVMFPNDTNIVEVPVKKEQVITVFISSEEDVEYFELCVYIPEEIEIRKHFGTQLIKVSCEYDHPNHNLISYTQNFFRKKTNIGFQIMLFANEISENEIIVSIKGKEIKHFKQKLFLKITK